MFALYIGEFAGFPDSEIIFGGYDINAMENSSEIFYAKLISKEF
jgi:hypothetical protein